MNKLDALEKIKTKPFYLSIFDSWRNDKDFVLEALDFDKNAYFSAGHEAKKDDDIIEKTLLVNSNSFEHLPLDCKKNKSIVKKVLIKNGEMFKYIDKELKEDEELVCLAAETFPNVWNLLSAEMKKNSKVIQSILRKNIQIFKKLSSEYKNNQDFLNIIIENDQFNADFLNGVHQDFLTQDFLAQCIQKDSNALLYGTEKQKKDKKLILNLLRVSDVNLLKYVDKDLKNDLDFMKKAIKIEPEAFKYGSLAIQNDKKIVLEVIQKNPYLFSSVTQKFKMDKDIVYYALQGDAAFTNYTYVGYPLKRLGIKDDIEDLKQIIEKMMENEKELTNLDNLIESKPEDSQQKKKVIKI
jgi:hypothetical protein